MKSNLEVLRTSINRIAERRVNVSRGCIACMQGRDAIALPLRDIAHPREPAALRTLQVLKRFDFEPTLMRSGIIARAEHRSSHGAALLFVKGAPSRIKPLLRGASVPDDFQQVIKPSCSHLFRCPVWFSPHSCGVFAGWTLT